MSPHKRILTAVVAALAFFFVLPGAEAREPPRFERQVAPSDELLLEENTYLPAQVVALLYYDGMQAAESGDNEVWQQFCSKMYVALTLDAMTPVPTNLIGQLYATCLDISSSSLQNKKNWVENNFGVESNW